MTISVFQHDVNDWVNQLKDSGSLPAHGDNNNPDVMSGCWGVRLDIKSSGDIRPWLKGLGKDTKAARNTCIWTAQPMYTAGSGLGSSGNANRSQGKNQDFYWHLVLQQHSPGWPVVHSFSQ